MKRLNAVLFTIIAVFITTAAYAGVGDTLKGWLGAFSWQAIAYILTGLLGIGILAKKREWVAALLIATGALMKGLGDIPTVIGIGIADGKIDPEEIKAAKAEIADIPSLIKTVVACFKGK